MKKFVTISIMTLIVCLMSVLLISGSIFKAEAESLTECEHTYKWVIDVAPTCDNSGMKHEVCVVCGETRNENTVIDALFLGYTISNGEAMITYWKSGIGTDVVIPHTIDGYPVTTIKTYAFEHNHTIKSVSIPSSVKTIEWGAFPSCDALEVVWYGGNSPSNISIGDGNEYLTSVVWNCNACVMNSETHEHLFYNDVCDSVCNNCGWVRSVSGEHVYTDESDCICNECDDVRHLYEWVVDVEATCGVSGSRHEECSVCNATRNENTVIKPTGVHTYEWIIDIEPTFTTTGLKHEECSGCGATRNNNTMIDVLLDIGTTPDGLGYEIINRKTVAITGYTGTATSVVIPSTIAGYPVTAIDNYAFSSCNTLTSVTIPDTVTSIGYQAFAYCLKLENIVIPDSVTEIGSNAFVGCTGLTSVTIGSGLKTVYGGSDSYAGAFRDCNNLTSVYIKDLAAWCAIDFGTYTSNPLYYAKKLHMVGSTTPITNLIIPDGVTEIGRNAFSGFSTMTSVTIPSSVKTIGGFAFRECNGLTNVEIPDSVTNIGYYAFYKCSGLKSVVIGDGVTTIGDGAFSYCSSLASVEIGDSVTLIDVNAFNSCTSLTSVNIPNSVTYIGNYAFNSCTFLTSVVIPDSVTYIGNYTFYGCSKITNVDIGKGVASVGERAFYGCNSIKTLTITKNLITIYSRAFYSAPNKTVYFEGTSAEWYSMSYSTSSNITYAKIVFLCFDEHSFAENNGCLECVNCEYNTHNYEWITDVEAMLGKYGLKHEECSVCGSRRNENTLIEALTTTTTADGLVSKLNADGTVTITGYTGTATSVVIPSTIDGYPVVEIGVVGDIYSKLVGVFENNTSLKSVVISDGILRIGSDAFYGCSRLTSITIPDSVTVIGSSAFQNCYSLTSVDIGGSVTTIGDNAFRECGRLTSLTIPNSVTTIGDYTFSGCSRLTSLIIPDSVTTIGGYAFNGCTGLTSVTIGSGITTVTDQFAGCNNIKTLTITKNLTEMDVTSFDDSSVETLYFKGNRSEWENMIYSTDYQFENTTVVCSCLGEHDFTDENDCICNTCEFENHKYEWITDQEATCVTDGMSHEKCTVCGITRNENTVIKALGHSYDDYADVSCNVCGKERGRFDMTVSADAIKKGDTVTVIVTLYGCEKGTSYGIAVNHGDKLELIEGILGRTDGLAQFDIVTKKGSFAYTDGLTDLNGTVITLTFKGAIASETAEEISIQLIVRNGSDDLYNGTATATVNVVCDVHSFSDWEYIKAPTCIEYGEETRVCSVCGNVETRVVAPTGIHVFDDDEDKECNTCDYVKYVAGDVDGKEGISDADAIYLLLHTYFPEDYPISQPCDFDGNGKVNDQDAVHLLFHTYFPEDYPLPTVTVTTYEAIIPGKEE